MTQLERRLLAGLVGVDLRTVARWEEDPSKTLPAIARMLAKEAELRGFKVEREEVLP